MIFGLSRSPGFISHAIRLFSWGSWSHAFLVIDGMVYESREFVGVHCVPYAAAVAGTSAVQLFRVPSTPEQDQTIMAFACAHLGKAYDYRGIIGFISHREEAPHEYDARVFCSDYVFEAAYAAGIKFYRDRRGYQITPSMLEWSEIAEPLDSSAQESFK